ncbi:IS91 family transposase, partial [Endozoicomonas acroporae]
GCRTTASGMTLLECNACQFREQKPLSCGHRHCNRCQNTDTSEWLQRQRQKLLPVEYFMVTFTLPAQLRALAWQHQRQVCDLLFRTAADTLKQFGANNKKLDADLGMTGVLHTHSRRLDYHPHIHFVVPGGGINTRRKEWRKLTGNYLFNGKNLAIVFRARLLRVLDEQGLLSLSLKTRLPKEWVVNCKRVGKGLPALEYLSRYLYRGVISDNNILASKRGKVTFSYLNSETGKKETRTLPGEDFLWLVLKHVLPRRFRRLRDYGFLHSNAKKQLSLVQLVLHVMVKAVEPVIRPQFTCRRCGAAMKHIAFSFLKPT